MDEYFAIGGSVANPIYALAVHASAGLSVVVVGGGIAGASAAAALAQHPVRPAVTLIEAEPQLAHHTTGRSAAQLLHNYGAAPERALTAASLDGFDGFLSPRPVLTVATEPDTELFVAELKASQSTNSAVAEISVEEALTWFPRLRAPGTVRAMVDPSTADIDVAGLHASMVSAARSAGAIISTGEALVSALPTATGGWDVTTTANQFGADIIVNCAGAWGDEVAIRCSVVPIGLAPLRRTAFMVASPDGTDSADWPLLVDVAHRWYCKPDGPQFLCSPADETPSEPCDARPDEIDVAQAIDRINAQTTLGIRSVRSAWAGLRTFSPDRSMVIGHDPDLAGFVWCVGQGGTGIQTAPAAGRLTADLALQGSPGPRFDGVPLDVSALAPDRFRTPGSHTPGSYTPSRQ